MKTLKRQQGMSPVVVLLVCCIFAFSILVGVKILPVYIDYSTLRTAFSDTMRDPDIKGADYNKIRKMVGKRLLINGIRDFDFRESAFVDAQDGTTYVGFEYEKRVHLFLNIDAIMSFSYETEVKVK